MYTSECSFCDWNYRDNFYDQRMIIPFYVFTFCYTMCVTSSLLELLWFVSHPDSLNCDNYQFWASLFNMFQYGKYGKYVQYGKCYLECHLRTFVLPPNLTRYCHSWVNPVDQPFYCSGYKISQKVWFYFRLYQNQRIHNMKLPNYEVPSADLCFAPKFDTILSQLSESSWSALLLLRIQNLSKSLVLLQTVPKSEDT